MQIRRDALRRETARIDGRGNVTRTEYDALGRVAATIDALSDVDANYTYAYQYDDIGNRMTSEECGARSAEYVANELNQYTQINTSTSESPCETFSPEFDDDGNQTLIRTATGEWRVTYNGENRPVLWTCLAASDTIATNADTIAMSYDRQGRRVTKNSERFVYDGYLQIANHRSTTTPTNYNSFIWDPTEPVATRPLAWNNSSFIIPNSSFYYTHDGNKNVSEVVVDDGAPAAHYEYAPFGVATTQCGTSAAANFWRFSSEYADGDMAVAYYNFRYYFPCNGRWTSRDPALEIAASRQMQLSGLLEIVETSFLEQKCSSYYSLWQDYLYLDNNHQYFDFLGLSGKYDPPPTWLEVPFPPCCQSQRTDCKAACASYANFSRALCDLNFVFKFRCRCVCKWNLSHSTKTGFPGYTRDVDCTYKNSNGKEHTIGYYGMPTWFKCPAYIELGCP